MRRALRLAVIACTLACAAARAGELPIVPVPASAEAREGAFPLSRATPIVVTSGDVGMRRVATLFAEMVRKSNGFALSVKRGTPCDGCIVLEAGTAPGAESYRLDVDARRVTLSAATATGLFRGATSLWQMIPPHAEAPAIPAARIDDAPRFAWRGVMLDSARQYQSPEFILRFIDAMALEKLNVLHWHLTDDQAWRLEIRKYPRLTQVGAWRVPAGNAPAHDIDPATAKPRLYGGFYSQATVRRIVNY